MITVYFQFNIKTRFFVASRLDYATFLKLFETTKELW